jgi:hypothetical protein
MNKIVKSHIPDSLKAIFEASAENGYDGDKTWSIYQASTEPKMENVDVLKWLLLEHLRTPNTNIETFIASPAQAVLVHPDFSFKIHILCHSHVYDSQNRYLFDCEFVE